MIQHEMFFTDNLYPGTHMHVRVYTIRDLLESFGTNMNVLDLDNCMRDLIPILMDAIFGNVAAEKTNRDWTNRPREVADRRSSDQILGFLAEKASVPLELDRLISAIQGQPCTYYKMTQVLQIVQNGIAQRHEGKVKIMQVCQRRLENLSLHGK